LSDLHRFAASLLFAAKSPAKRLEIEEAAWKELTGPEL
jgi:hypothetical protein